jgi:hypothetical protein
MSVLICVENMTFEMFLNLFQHNGFPILLQPSLFELDAWLSPVRALVRPSLLRVALGTAVDRGLHDTQWTQSFQNVVLCNAPIEE